MRRLMLFLVLVCSCLIPINAQGHTTCRAHAEPTSLDLEPEWFIHENWYEYLTAGVLDYLNTTDSADGLVSSLENEEAELITARVYFADVNSDGVDDILLMTLLDYGGGYSYQMAVYTCDDGAYRILGDFVFDEYGEGSSLELIADTNGNNVPEIIMRSTYTPRKYYETLDFYEWNGTEFILLFQTAWQYGGYSDMYLTNFDEDPTSVEILVERFYSYSEATAEAYIELSLHRPVNIVYQWTGDTYTQVCEYFTDTPSILYQVLHSAEAHRQCGQYNAAVEDYARITQDYRNRDTGEYLLEGTWGDVAFSPEHNAEFDSRIYERDYLTAFAYYRLVQLELYQNEYNATDNALAILTRMQENFPSGERGYRYTAMAEAFYAEFVEAGDINAACAAAENAFNAVRDTDADPPTPYYNYLDGGQMHYPFYWSSGKIYSPEPDNLFDVPEDIANIIFIPVCVQ